METPHSLIVLRPLNVGNTKLIYHLLRCFVPHETSIDCLLLRLFNFEVFSFVEVFKFFGTRERLDVI